MEISQTTSNKVPKVRNTNIEILRLVLMIFICSWHIIIHGYNFKDIGLPTFSYDGNMLFLTFLLAVFSPSVYCFMFISGWYGLKFSLNKIYQLAFTAFICLLIAESISFFWTGELDLRYTITHILPIATRRYWFLTDYVMVFLIAPFIEIGIKQIDLKTFKHIICIMTYLEVMNLLSLYPYSGYSFFGLLYIYVLARYLRITNLTASKTQLLLLYSCSLIFLWLLCYFCTTFHGNYIKLTHLVLGYNNPLVIIMAITQFLLIKDLRPFYNLHINKLLSGVLAIYLLTEGIDTPLYKYEAALFDESWWKGFLSIFIIVSCSLLIGRIISILSRH